MTMKTKRQSSIELLRIVAVILIFWMHKCGSFENNEISAWLSILIATVGNVGVSCCMIISGYFGMRLSVKKVLKLEFMLLFYSWTTLLINIVRGGLQNIGGLEELARYLLPVIGRRMWFFTCYMVVLFLSPFLNEVVEIFSKKKLEQFLITMLILFSGITTFFFFDVNQDGGKGVIHLVMVYMIGRYLCLYRDREYSVKKLLAVFGMTVATNFVLNGVLYVLSGTIQNRFARDNTLFTILEAVCLFLIFRSMHFKNGTINRLASHVPAAFNMEGLLTALIGGCIIPYSTYKAENWYEILLLAVAIVMFLAGCLIDMMRKLVFDRAEDKVIKWIEDIIEEMKKKVSLLARLTENDPND
jgi:hypothetical protein